jgi:DNA-binding transcriptional LysR family regulator
MQLHQLEYFVAAAEERSVTRAAERLRVAQPGVSAQIRKLERELGHPLLERTTRGVALTPVGSEVLPAARAALAAVAAVQQVVDDVTGLVRGRLAVGAVTSLPALDLPGILADFHHAHPDVEITLAEGGSAALLDALRAGRLDLALVGVVGADPEDLHVEALSEEPLVVVVAPDDPLASRPTVQLAELAQRVFVAPAPGNALREALDQAFAGAPGGPRIAFEAGEPAVVARMVARGLGVALLPASLRAVRDGQVRAVAVTGPLPRTRLALAWRRGYPVSPAARALTRRVLEQ